MFGGTLSWFNKHKAQGIVTIGGTPGSLFARVESKQNKYEKQN